MCELYSEPGRAGAGPAGLDTGGEAGTVLAVEAGRVCSTITIGGTLQLKVRELYSELGLAGAGRAGPGWRQGGGGLSLLLLKLIERANTKPTFETLVLSRKLINSF